MNDTRNPVLVEIVRGDLVESRHAGAVAIADAQGRLVLALGDVERPIYPRSAIKALQALPLIESGAADAFGLDAEELAVACASHSGDTIHVAAVRRLLGKAGLDESYLACGAHWPVSETAMESLLRAVKRPQAIHNNCSGKHAGMLATAIHLGLSPKGYERVDHPVQIAIAAILSELCGIELDRAHAGIDGCSVPTFALPLSALARGFARFGTGEELSPSRANAALRLMQACFAAPVLVAGEGRFDTLVLQGLAPQAFVKGGAEGVHCGVLPELGLGFALKIDDGAKRADERTVAELLATLLPKARTVLAGQLQGEIRNWRGLKVGRLAASAELQEAAASLATPRRPSGRAAR
ncbi:MAG: asparaginase [Alphaproteobacteria bacterium]|nr:asparaginase [Alphaproteobacteria bacterium]